MKAAIIDALGQLPRFGDFAEPLAEGDEIVVTVTAASIKQLDRAIAAGTHYSSPRELPVIPGRRRWPTSGRGASLLCGQPPALRRNGRTCAGLVDRAASRRHGQRARSGHRQPSAWSNGYRSCGAAAYGQARRLWCWVRRVAQGVSPSARHAY